MTCSPQATVAPAAGHGNEFLQADLREAAHFPAGQAQALVSALDVRTAEVHALPDASVDDVVGDRLPVGVGAGNAECVRAGQRYESRRARAEEGVEDALLRADLAAVAAGVFGVLRGRPERRPGWVLQVVPGGDRGVGPPGQ